MIDQLGEIKQTTSISNNKILKIIFYISLFLMIIIGYMMLKNKNPQEEKKKITSVNPTISTSTQKLTPKYSVKKTNSYLNLKINNQNLEINKPFFVSIIADSDNEQVVGADILIKFDQKKLKYLGVASGLKQFSVYPNFVDNYLNLTLVKNLTEKEPIFFSKASLINLNFEPIEKGKIDIELIANYKNRKTFFTNEKTEIIYPQLSEKITIIVK